jgi:hypothetical protein
MSFFISNLFTVKFENKKSVGNFNLDKHALFQQPHTVKQEKTSASCVACETQFSSF